MDITKLNRQESAKFLLENGLLFEINWKVLHPFGLALAVTEDTETGEIDFLGIQKTDDITGWEFDEETFISALHKLKSFVCNGENIERLSKRKQALGGTIQNGFSTILESSNSIQKGLI